MGAASPKVDQLVELVGAWMPAQRWYANKGGTPQLEWAGSWSWPSGADGLLVATHLFYDSTPGKSALYQVPLTIREHPLPGSEHALVGTAEGAHIYDGPHDPAYTGALLEAVLTESRASGEAIEVAGHRAGGPAGTANPGDLRSRVLSGEQSNTSIIYEPATGSGSPLICKVFRALHAGDNPDVELQTALAATGSTAVPQPAGHLAGRWTQPGEESASGHLAFVQEFLPGVEDAWRVALRAAGVGEDFGERAHALGVTTAEVHAGLASALQTTVAGPADISAAISGMRARLEAAIDAVPGLEEHRAELERLFDRAATSSWPAFQRVHGDYHLGQVLAVPGGWAVVDFEGEPLRPMHERSRLDEPLRDVAGMLRSFDYVAGSLALTDGTVNAGDWAARAREAFIAGYVTQSGLDLPAAQPVLDAFEVDKALYEVVYEARNRPDWIAIPVGAITRLVHPLRADLT